jgi:phosphate/phosphite/phosphonate ABC transporter binding protein
MAQGGDSRDPQGQGTSMLAPTRVLAGKYRLGRMLGEGGMGAVYEAEHQGLGSRVAVKLLSDTGITDPKMLARFRREAKAMGAIRHENVVTVMDTGTDDGVPFLVMELLEGESLAGMLRRERVISAELACWIMGQLLAGLSAAHAVGVVHRDLKPENVFITSTTDGTHRVKLLDFGISKLGDATATMNVTVEGTLLGTPNFMAPEQIQPTVPLDRRVDIYAAGVMLYRMVCGRLPFVGRNSEELHRVILESRPMPPTQYAPTLAPELEAIILKAMHRDRDRRFPDATSFASALRELMPPQQAASLPTPPPSMPIHRPPPTQEIVRPRDPTTDGSYATAPASSASYLPTPPEASGEVGATLAARPSSLRARSRVVETARRPRWLALAVGLALLLGAGGMFLYTHLGGEPRGAGAAAGADRALRFGITRHKSPEEIEREMRPLLEYLAARADRPLELVILENYKDVADELLGGAIDLGALSASSYVRAKRRQPDLRLLATPVTQAGDSYEGYVLARAGDGIDELADFAGKVFCFVSETSTSGYLYPRALFRRAGMDPDSAFKATRFTTDHTASIRALDAGACDGAAVYDSAWSDAHLQGIDPTRFTLVAKTERIPWDAYAVTHALDEATAARLAEALAELEVGSEAAREVLLDSDARFVGFLPGDDTLYDSVRRIEKYLAAEPGLAD